jgi:hypothetical protein
MQRVRHISGLVNSGPEFQDPSTPLNHRICQLLAHTLGSSAPVLVPNVNRPLFSDGQRSAPSQTSLGEVQACPQQATRDRG